MHRGYSWLYTQVLLLAVLGFPYGMLGFKPELTVCKANALPAVLSLQPRVVPILTNIIAERNCLEYLARARCSLQLLPT